MSDRDGDEDIYVMKLAPERLKNVPVKLTKNTRPDPNGPPYMYDFEPDWSPDGRQIVFTSDRSGNMEIYRMKAVPEGSKNRPINLSKSPSSYDSSPAWSPDGKQIAFASDRPAPDGTKDFEIWRMRAGWCLPDQPHQRSGYGYGPCLATAAIEKETQRLENGGRTVWPCPRFFKDLTPRDSRQPKQGRRGFE